MLYTKIPTQRPHTPLLDSVDYPAQLRQLSVDQLATLADELRHYLLYAAGQSGGHFGANLGVVELTVALHYCFNTPHDRLIWDVGHQAYTHKLLTGRSQQRKMDWRHFLPEKNPNMTLLASDILPQRFQRRSVWHLPVAIKINNVNVLL